MTWELELDGRVGFSSGNHVGGRTFLVEGISWSKAWLGPWFTTEEEWR